MSGRITRVVPTTAALVAALALYLATPAEPRAASAECGGEGGPVCSVLQLSDCVKFFCFTLTAYFYYDMKAPLRG